MEFMANGGGRMLLHVGFTFHVEFINLVTEFLNCIKTILLVRLKYNLYVKQKILTLKLYTYKKIDEVEVKKFNWFIKQKT